MEFGCCKRKLWKTFLLRKSNDKKEISESFYHHHLAATMTKQPKDASFQVNAELTQIERHHFQTSKITKMCNLSTGQLCFIFNFAYFSFLLPPNFESQFRCVSELQRLFMHTVFFGKTRKNFQRKVVSFIDNYVCFLLPLDFQYDFQLLLSCTVNMYIFLI